MKVAVVIPSYKVTRSIEAVIKEIPEIVSKIYVIDDACPDHSGSFTEKNVSDPRVKVLYNEQNLGVGGAVKHGYEQAIKERFDIVVKLDGDGQMDPKNIPLLIQPILNLEADYTKGNRFFNLEFVSNMPAFRFFGNSVLSLLAKFATGYWECIDPTNGYTAIHRIALSRLPLDKISNRYFFEIDTLFRLNLARSKVIDVPMPAIYGDEISHLSIVKTALEFPYKLIKRLFKRMAYSYFIHDFNHGTFQLISGLFLGIFSIIFGVPHWLKSVETGIPAPTGSIMVTALSVLLGFQLLLSALLFDVSRTPKDALVKLFDNKS